MSGNSRLFSDGSHANAARAIIVGTPNDIAGQACPQSTKSARLRFGARPQRAGNFRGSTADLRDGFIHFSTAAQVKETAAKHFAGQDDLVLLRVDAEKLGDALKWEPSRGGALFPHLYGAARSTAVSKADPLPLGPDGDHRFPPLEG